MTIQSTWCYALWEKLSTLSLLPRFDWKVWHKSRNVRLQVLKKPEFLKKRHYRISTLIIVFTAYLFHSNTFPNFLLNFNKFLHYTTLFDNLILKIAFSTSNNLLLLVEFYSNISVCTCTINDKKLLKNEIKVSLSRHFFIIRAHIGSRWTGYYNCFDYSFDVAEIIEF